MQASKDGSSVHPAVLALGLRYADGSITGSTARCVALVHALCQVRAWWFALLLSLLLLLLIVVTMFQQCPETIRGSGPSLSPLHTPLNMLDTHGTPPPDPKPTPRL
jgi:hypothetical protein